MLKSSYDKLEDVPENLRGAYIPKDGKLVLDDLANDHPVVTKREELLAANTTLKQQNTRLTNEKASLEQNVIPAGQKAMPEADAELLEVIKPHVSDKKAAKTLIDEHKTFKAEHESIEQAKSIKKALKLAGFNDSDETAETVRLLTASLGVKPEFKEETVDGKKVEKAYIGDKLFTDYVEQTPALKAISSVLTGGAAPQPVSTEAGSGNRPVAGGEQAAGAAAAQSNYRFTSPGDVKWE